MSDDEVILQARAPRGSGRPSQGRLLQACWSGDEPIETHFAWVFLAGPRALSCAAGAARLDGLQHDRCTPPRSAEGGAAQSPPAPHVYLARCR